MKLFTRTALAVLVAAATASAAWADAREVRIASHVSEFSPLHAQSKLFAEEIENRLPGQFVFKLYPSGQLGKEKDLMARRTTTAQRRPTNEPSNQLEWTN